ncbi:hypothetical protein DBR32_09465 [Taibaiella sp. KBW10]|uniref:DUF5689 domain-containing protein n=1 Tax=Taibaiella sp. KBW10 TaxID=2153357 RepID=UPI000F5A8EA1|nr:DUF5689 domain-containing protein [Taibaiella sp. KBW10]RQO30929.1 hypothetical protein DBR32_09465 [Taibaiella sp. KBW10]
MKKLSLLLLCSALVATTFTFESCVKKGNDAPIDNTGFDPNLKVTHTIAQLLAMPTGVAITQDVVVSGVVVMDDRSGNYYKKFVIQDATGGLEINLDQNNIYNDYPVGRKVYIKCKGLSMATYGGMVQLGYGLDERQSIVSIPFVMADNFIVKANYPNTIKVDTFTYDELANANANGTRLNTLVAIRDVEFANGAYGMPFAAPNATTNRALNGCGAASSGIVVRSSNYARFQPTLTPTGKGVIVGLYTKYNATPQLIIRDVNDLNFVAERCDGSIPVAPVFITIDSLRNKYAGSPLSLSGIKITGTVISDRANGNGNGQNLIIQQGNKGIMIRFTSAHSFNLGDSVVVITNGTSLEEFRGTLQVNNTQLSTASRVGTGTITPTILTLLDLNNNFEAHESTLVKILNATVAGSGSFGGNQTLSDGTATITLYTATGASFSGTATPTTAKNFSGIAGQYDATKQLQMRNITDVE